MNYLEQNLAIMRTRDPQLALIMESDIDCSHIEVFPSSKPDILTARVTLPSGEKVLLHNLEDPIGSAERSAEKQEMKGENASILLGFGLGYLSIELQKKLEKKHPMLICEADPAILKTALRSVDLRDVLASDFIRILVGEEIPLQEWIARLSAKFMTASVEVISYQPARSVNPEAYQRLQEIAQKEARAILLNRNTILKAGCQMMENFIHNVPDVLQSAGVARLENLFKGQPAILVSAGPSLEKNVHLLKDLEGRAVIIAVDTTLRLLLPLGITPDIVTTIDFNPVNFQKFNNVPIPPDISLVYHPGGYYESIQAFGGPRFTSQVQNRFPAWMMQYVGDKGSLPSGTTVAHMSFHLARHMGCDPIIMIGQDLAFPRNQLHAGDLSLWQMDTNDMDMIEDIFGEQVGSMTSFKHGIYHLEKAFKETQATIIDATEGGAKKQGAQVMRLADVIDEYCQGPYLNVKGMLREASTLLEPVRLGEFMHALEGISGELTVIQQECRRIITLAGRLNKKIRADEMTDDQFIKLSLLAEKLTEEMNGHGKVLHLMGEHNFGLELYMAGHAIASIDEMEEPDQKIREQVERAKVFYPSVLRASAAFKKPLDRLIRRLTVARELSAQELTAATTAENFYQRALNFKKIDYRREALDAVRQALAKKPEHAPALKLLAHLCLASNWVPEALEVVDTLKRTKTTDRTVGALAQETETKQAAWAERCARLQAQLLTDMQEDSLEEAGWFYYRVKNYPRAVAKLERASLERPTAETFARLGHAKCKTLDVEGAVRAWEQALALDPTRADLYKELATVTLNQGQKEPAEQFFQEAVRLEPDDAGSWESLARLSSDRGAYAEAGFCYEQLLRLTPARVELISQIAALYQHQIALARNTQ